MRREAIAILSSGALVAHSEFNNPTFLDPTGADLARVDVPLLRAHNPHEVIGHVREAWRSGILLKAVLRFNATSEGIEAYEELESGAVRGVSVGTCAAPGGTVVVDAFGAVHEFDETNWRQYWQPFDSVLHIKRWSLIEVSMTPRPADHRAIAHPIDREAKRIRSRMQARQQRALDGDDVDDGMRRVVCGRMASGTARPS